MDKSILFGVAPQADLGPMRESVRKSGFTYLPSDGESLTIPSFLRKL